ncbi:MAG: RluA family pseudouridine synthase [Planctomycetota bacterium]|nr:MAG: RluA family pseudouridine synthase [Planctomycetota bacterium]
MTAGGGDRRVFHVDAAIDGQSIVAALRCWHSDLTWSAGKKLLAARRVSINGAMCLDAARRVGAGDVVHVFETPRTPQPTAADVEVLYSDASVVVVVKPALMTTQRHREERNWSKSRRNRQPTLEEVLPEILQGSVSAGRSSAHGRRRKANRSGRRGRSRHSRMPQVYAVHRLDRDTSGVMVFARTPPASQDLIRQFKRHTNDRVYQAIVLGRPEDGTIETRIIRDRGDGLRGSTTDPNAGQRAVTHVRVLESLGDYSRVECRLETGRTHQIRVHLAERGHLVCGDPLYRKRMKQSPIKDTSGAPRLALHAARLAFDHPQSGERLTFETDLPDDLARFVKRLRSARNRE